MNWRESLPVMEFHHLQNNASWDCFKTPICWEILRTQNLLLVEHYVYLAVKHLFQ